MHPNKKELQVLWSYKIVYVIHSVLAKLGLNLYTVKKKSLLVLDKEKILQFITWFLCVGAAGLEERKSNKIWLCF